ncbi:hypothetical protein BGW38_002181 [Lunasporangiospora selenospora]|uniref:Rab-GAP TBC domain-containing protein n=1 Tax=Lunasporangiospora selenospora TaxID=979761 RepID=A0A9P6FUJ6_9FUNG|nr:hypothetical protein BGW38_002181 [Lunasporangiospora selenospora]
MARTKHLLQSKHQHKTSTSVSSASVSTGTLRNRKSKETKESLDKEKQDRIRRLDNAILKGDIEQLRKLSLDGLGFVNNGIRRRAWPLLLRTHVPRKSIEDDDKTPHRDEGQVQLDVVRSYTHLSTDNKSRQSDKKQKQDELQEVIVSVLQRHPELSYYQGFHDVCTCLLTVLGGKEAAKDAAESIAMFFFRDCMLENLDFVLEQLGLVMTLLRLEDKDVYDFLERTQTMPFFSLSWVITWCAHDLNDFDKVARLYDFFLCHNPLMPVYFAASVVITRREELFQVEDDSAMVHTFLTKFPKDIDLEECISRAHLLYTTYPPAVLQKHANRSLDESSCVNTFDKVKLRLYDLHDKDVATRAVDFDPIDVLLSQPRAKRTEETTATTVSKRSHGGKQLFPRSLVTVVALSATASTGAILMLLSSPIFK